MKALLPASLLLLAATPPVAAEEVRARPNTLTPQEVAGGWVLLFDGRTTSGWHSPNGSKWTVFRGMLAPQAGKPGLLVTDARFRQFQMKLQYLARVPDPLRPFDDPGRPRILLGCGPDGRPAAGGGYKLFLENGSFSRLLGRSRPGRFSTTGWVDLTVRAIDRGKRYTLRWSSGGRDVTEWGTCDAEGRAGDGHIALTGNGFVVRDIRIVELPRPTK
jgi:hypothetical protein